MKYIIVDEYNAKPAENICFNSLADAEEYVLSIAENRAYDGFIESINLTDITLEQYFNCMEEETSCSRFVTYWGNTYDYFTYDYHIYEMREM